MKSTTILALAGLVTTTLCISAAQAFEVDTHARISNAAWSRFSAGRPALFDDLGLVRPSLKTDAQYNAYIDMTQLAPDLQFTSVRYYYLWELAKILGENPDGLPPVTEIDGRPDQWFAQGAVREDDYAGGPNPADDVRSALSPNVLYRVLNSSSIR